LEKVVVKCEEQLKLKGFELSLQQVVESKLIRIEDVDAMGGYDFEDLVANLFAINGYRVKQTGYSGDQGVDVIANKDVDSIAIQAKRYSKNVDNSAIQEVVAGARHYSCNKKIVITNSYFTNSAIELAATNDVLLWNRDKLIELINKHNLPERTC